MRKEDGKGLCICSRSRCCRIAHRGRRSGGGTDKKPVGLTYIGVCVNGRIRVKKYLFSGNRMKIRESAVAAALTLLRKCLLEDEL